MSLWMLALGAAVIVVALADTLTTTLRTTGAGPITGSLTRAIFRAAQALHRRTGSRKVLAAAGVVSLVATTLAWVVLLWTGWLLVYGADPNAVVDAKTQSPANLAARIYFTGYTLFTLGNGDFVPRGLAFQVLTPVAALTGLFLVTLAITYLVPVVSAAIDKRLAALSIKGMGETPAGILESAWDGSGFPGLDQLLSSTASMVTLHGERHLAYPIVHYYHTTDPGASAPVRIAALDEAVTLLAHGVAPEARPSKAALNAARSAVTSYLDTLTAMYVSPAAEAPPPPDLRRIQAAGIPVLEISEFQQAVDRMDQRRRLLLANVLMSGWTWEDVVRASSPSAVEVGWVRQGQSAS